MKLANFAFIALLAIVVSSCGSKSEEKNEQGHQETTTVEAVTYSIDTEASHVTWQGNVINVYFHSGTVNFNSGSITTENNTVTAGDLSVNMTQINTTDSNYNEKAPAHKLVSHLQGEEFFNTAKFPDVNFTITSSEGGVVKGDLTIKGITHEQTLENLSLEEKDGVLNATGTLTFDRQAYEMKWVHYIKDYTLSDDVDLKITITGKAS
jgi:polyisoprenoid-binding protein YceI